MPVPPKKKPVAKPAAKKPVPAAGVPTWYDANGKPNAKGLYNRDGFMARTSAPKDDFKKAPPKERVRSAEEIAIARRSGYTR